MQLAWVCTLVLCGVVPLAAQGASAKTVPEVILTRPTCTSCRVISTPVGQLGGSGEPVDDARGFNAMRSHLAGDLLLAPATVPEVWRVGRDGTIKARYGRKGGGPGEFESVDDVISLAGDSFAVFDDALARLSLFDRSGKFVRTFRVPSSARQVLPLEGDKAVVTGFVRASGKNVSGLPLHLIDHDSVISSFGPPVLKPDAREPFQSHRHLVSALDGIVVVNRAYRYAIERYAADGRVIARLAREVDWFEPYEQFRVVSTEPPPPMIVGTWMGSGSELWVVSIRAAPRWLDAWSTTAAAGEGGKRIVPLKSPEKLYTSMVEVFDLKLGTLIVSTPLPYEIRYVAGRGLVGQMKYDSPGGRYVVLHELTLRR